ncbi:hypothetical protein [Neobacillus terrae]|uniref:hypothetical protein n=1 Tax=Neobacillus terrae TaxID=3034837 RepID=UPI001408EA74|nr:hypothetical protein [Neobacillus terrae]NHM29527.1 hypothetical protein [Neobacillus terrae]
MEKDKKERYMANPPKDMDSPEQYPTDKESLFDKFESEQNVDPIPMEDLREEQIEEKEEHVSKHTSSSDKKYKTGM